MSKEIIVDQKFSQVIQELDNGKIRVYDIEQMHIGNEDDPLTTIRLSGKHEDITP